ncbi:MAG: PD40 domain-containing protein [Anaerolineae bacterium]|nr:PD40 domain-containing protein [Anaerolineae bacterium]
MIALVGRLVMRMMMVACVALVGVRAAGLMPDEGMLAFASDRDGDLDIYLLDVRTGFAHNLRRGDRIAQDDQPAWSPDGMRLAFRSNLDGINRLMVYDMRAGTSAQAAPDTVGTPAMTPAWAPDGMQIAVVVPGGMLGLVDAASGQTNFPRTTIYPLTHTWSPDGTQIIYSRTYSLFSVRLYALDLLSGAQRVLTPARGAYTFPAWSPAHDTLAVIHLRDIFLLDPACLPGCIAQEQRLTRSAEFKVWPTWSPDGRRIAFECLNNASSQICVIDVETGERRQLTFAPDHVRNIKPTWRPQ